MYEPLSKIGIQTDDRVETLWAEPVGVNQYRLDNSPFFAYGVSWQDVIEAVPGESGMPIMRRVIAKSGHRTIRIILAADARIDPNAQSVLKGVKAFGCSYEGVTGRYVSIDIPPEVDLQSVAGF